MPQSPDVFLLNLQTTPTYDFIIAGSGCAGLSLLVRLLQEPAFNDKKILLVDRDEKQANDRTWCYWERGAGMFEPVVKKTWEQLWFRSMTLSRLFDLPPYRYKLIRGNDFYRFCLGIISKAPNVHRQLGEVSEVGQDVSGAFVEVNGERVYGHYLFNSLLTDKPVMGKNEYYLHQHFKGWVIATREPVFDPAKATMMDFRTSQHHGATFVYVMPFSETEALVEYTLFSPALLQQGEYEAGLKQYISQQLGIDEYEIREEENGVIPMTNYRFSRGQGRVINIGTAGGQTRGSTGYTFQFIQRHSAAIVKALKAGRDPLLEPTAKEKRAAFYDSVLLNILHHKTIPAHEIFTRLFARNDPRKVLTFLDKDNSLPEDIKLISTLPTLPFLKAAMQQWF
ncbi:MAG: lycopene cyclase [Chitinophagaceae bacterium]|nr:MAG: lycopene cyclase [Chitinophagaceae bacterium]